ncbi:ABC transporter permease [Spirosoma fluviale]|uniref:Putative ABC transport system permease protein n=1 Tax=Spirosoma fluviale TaxID=1597977 RepID=A0A286G110_9BACT|nr:ABC transporter permease [Spirosoma fluviale]SOD89132.1 putative ABC transport system permease protein [Spirosoma fluviale]
MLTNYIKIAFRNLTRNKVFSVINLLGLSTGITVCLLIFLFISNEFSVDNFHKNGKSIYRVMRGIENEGKEISVSYLSGPYAPALLTDFKGQITQAVRVNSTDALVTTQDKSFHERKIINADSAFFTFFTFPLLKGDPATVLTEPASVVLTESTAKKYFGSIDDAMGKIVKVDKNLPLKVTGIAQDVPANSHLDFDLVIPLENYKDRSWMNVWINNGLYTYVQLAPTVSEEQVERSFPRFMDKHMGQLMKQAGYHFTLSLTPLREIYFEQSAFDSVKHGDKKVVYIFLSIAILILLVACINFMNLSTVRAVERSKEIGVRKVLGAYKAHLVWQFIGESLLLTTLSCVLSLGLLALVFPFYKQLLGYPLNLSVYAGPIVLFLIGIIGVVGFLSGSYPAFVLAAFSPIQALKSKLRLGKGGTSLRQVLVVVQFSISILLMLGTAIGTRQMSYLKSKQLGYNKEQTLVVPIDNDDIYNFFLTHKPELLAQSRVEAVSMMSGEPGGFFDGLMFDVEAHPNRWKSRTEFADFDYVKTLGLKIIAGRDFSSQYPSDTTQAALINRTAAARLGWTPEAAIGKWLKNTLRDSTNRTVIGVVEDFNFLSLKEAIEPLVIAPNDDRRAALIRLKPGNLPATVETIQRLYAQTRPAYPFEYHFLDQKFDQMYQADLRQQTIMRVFAGLAIFIACMGLFGLASFSAQQRTKEIGVRKVLGASVGSIVSLLSGDFLKPVGIAILIASPIAWYVMHQWLQDFAYRVDLSWWVFAVVGLLAVAIALLTVSFQSVKAALMNPVKSLRSE